MCHKPNQPTTLGLSGPEGSGNEGVLCIPQISSTSGTSSPDSLISYLGHSVESNPLQRSSRCII